MYQLNGGFGKESYRSGPTPVSLHRPFPLLATPKAIRREACRLRRRTDGSSCTPPARTLNEVRRFTLTHQLGQEEIFFYFLPCSAKLYPDHVCLWPVSERFANGITGSLSKYRERSKASAILLRG